jgi:alpha-glucoside transport system permease protein
MTKLRHPLAALVVSIIALLWTIPTFGLLVTSFRPPWADFSSGWWTVFTQPNLTLNNYQAVLTGGDYLPGGITPYFFNSIAVAIPATIFPIALAAMAAYALNWMRVRGAIFILLAIVALQVVPIQMALLPLLDMFNTGWSLGPIPIVPTFENPETGRSLLAGNFVTLWIAHTIFALPFAIYLLFVFGSKVPKELIEAARVDGASHQYIFRKIFIPLTIPALASVAIFQFIWVWNDLLIAISFVGGGPQVAPITAYLSYLNGGFGQNQHLLTAAAFIAIALPLVVFFALQRYFVRGLTTGAINS